MGKLPRRAFINQGFGLLGALSVCSLAARGAIAAGSCADPASESLRESLHYTDAAGNPAQDCQACGFFTASDPSSPCGACTIMSGPVNAAGHCDSWSPRS